MLVLDVARARREVARAEHALASCRVREHETIAELYRFKAHHSATRLGDVEVDVGLIRAVVNEQDHHLCLPSFATDNPRAVAPDGTLPVHISLRPPPF